MYFEEFESLPVARSFLSPRTWSPLPPRPAAANILSKTPTNFPGPQSLPTQIHATGTTRPPETKTPDHESKREYVGRAPSPTTASPPRQLRTPLGLTPSGYNPPLSTSSLQTTRRGLEALATPPVAPYASTPFGVLAFPQAPPSSSFSPPRQSHPPKRCGTYLLFSTF